MSDSMRNKIRELEDKFIKVKTDYYRYVIRNEDKNIISKFSKIPECWDNYTPAEGTDINDDVKKRLNDVKNKKSWEMKLESLYLFYITDIESKITAVLQQRGIDAAEIDETIDSINSILLELDDNLLNFKHLMLTLAKRSVSDFYYILNSYCRFYFKRNFNFQTDVKPVLIDFVIVLNKYKNREQSVSRFIDCNNEISALFQKSSNQLGWRMNEFAVKEYLDSVNQVIKIDELNRIAKEAFEYKKRLAGDYSFLKYYYNETDGKMFRLNFISDSLKAKLEEGRISREIFDSYEDIKNTFRDYKNYFESAGLQEFGPERLSYIELLDFTYRVSKIIEFYYLRNMKYELLQNLRNDILFYVEKEIFAMKG